MDLDVDQKYNYRKSKMKQAMKFLRLIFTKISRNRQNTYLSGNALWPILIWGIGRPTNEQVDLWSHKSMTHRIIETFETQ